MSGLLLDTHVFLWHASADEKLSPGLRKLIETEPGQVFLSVVSAWEIAIKLGLGKLEIQIPLSDLLGPGLQNHGIELLPVTEADLVAYSALGFPDASHRDPFDRMVVVQAKLRGLAVASVDEAFKAYGVGPDLETR